LRAKAEWLWLNRRRTFVSHFLKKNLPWFFLFAFVVQAENWPQLRGPISGEQQVVSKNSKISAGVSFFENRQRQQMSMQVQPAEAAGMAVWRLG
jgi:hypothetical protein